MDAKAFFVTIMVVSVLLSMLFEFSTADPVGCLTMPGLCNNPRCTLPPGFCEWAPLPCPICE